MTRPGDGDHPGGGDPPLELELADVPRHLPRGPTRPPAYEAPTANPAPASTPSAATQPLPMPLTSGVVTYDEPNPWIGRGLLIALGAAALIGAYFIYKRVTRPDVFTVATPYRTHTGVTIDLPGGSGWKTDRRLRMKQTMGPAWMRGDVVFRGANVDASEEIVLTLRVHAPGGFPSEVDPELLRSGLERQLRQGVTQAGAMVQDMSCVVDTAVRPQGAVACFGRVSYLTRELPAGVYLWQAGTDDVLGIAYAATSGPLTPLMDLVRTAR